MAQGAAMVQHLNACCLPCCAQADAQIAAIQSVQEQRLNSLAPSARQAYNDLLAEQASLLAEAAHFEEESAELSATLSAAEGELSRNSFKQRVLEVQVCRCSRVKPERCSGVLVGCCFAPVSACNDNAACRCSRPGSCMLPPLS